ncbi:MAG: hypothetical protein Q8L11_00010 [Candidatus Moranbacteria bacterium]|nr:hypothetical protein [Candidatus Moranbacteria bacterium]
MKVNNHQDKYNRSIFQATSIKQEILEKYHDLHEFFDDVKRGKIDSSFELSKGFAALWDYTDFSEPIVLIKAEYDEKVTEEMIIKYLRGFGIEATGDLSSEALAVFEKKEKNNELFRDYMSGKSDIVPEGFSRDQMVFFKSVNSNFSKKFLPEIRKILKEENKLKNNKNNKEAE